MTNTLDLSSITDGDLRKGLPRYQEEFRENKANLAREFAHFAETRNYTVTKVALAWVLHQGDNIIPIPVTKRRKYLEQNSIAVDIMLKKEDLKEIENLWLGILILVYVQILY